MIDILSNVIINDFDFLIGTLFFYIKCTSFVIKIKLKINALKMKYLL